MKNGAKRTNDECYTPPSIYEIVRDWACREYGIDPARIVRPFYPGGDYQAFDYSGGAVVVDNPPFSILAEIYDWYLAQGVPFFLFAPSLTIFSMKKRFGEMNCVVVDCDIRYKNGILVRTSFLTSFGDGIVAQTAPELTEAINREIRRLEGKETAPRPKYAQPDEIVTAAMLQKYSANGIEWKIRREDCVRIRGLEEQGKEKCPDGRHKREIYGSGLLLSEQKTAEHTAIKRAVAARTAPPVWPLSDLEKALVKSMGRKEPPPGGAGYYYGLTGAED